LEVGGVNLLQSGHRTPDKNITKERGYERPPAPKLLLFTSGVVLTVVESAAQEDRTLRVGGHLVLFQQPASASNPQPPVVSAAAFRLVGGERLSPGAGGGLFSLNEPLPLKDRPQRYTPHALVRRVGG